MSRIGKKPIGLPGAVKTEIAGRNVKFTGPKGSLNWSLPAGVSTRLDGPALVVERSDDTREMRAKHGLARALLANMVKGVTDGYEIKLEVYGTGYTVKLAGSQLHLNLGFMGRGVGKAAQFMVDIPAGLKVTVEVQAARGENEPAKFTVSGIDKQAVGQFAAEVRKLRKPEPYKGKGVRYEGEVIKRKAGKAFGSS